MPDYLELRVDKFTFKIATDRYYSEEGVWVKSEGGSVRIGLSDYLQGRNGDVAFAEVKPVGTKVKAGDEIAVVETIKVNISLASPLIGRVTEVNPAMETSPEVINFDPYGDGWLAIINPMDWESDRQSLLEPQAYYNRIKLEAEREVEK